MMRPPEPTGDGPCNVLLVDDQPGKLLTYEAILQDLGENLIKVESARAALEVLLHTDVALILLDVQMPELDGFDLAAMIRQHPRFSSTSIIFVSGVHLSDLDRVRGYSAGAVDYVQVPVVPELLRARVRVFVDLFRKTRQLERLNRELEARVAARTAALEDSEERLRLALRAARAGAWEERDGGLRWTPGVFAVLGLDPEAVAPSTERLLERVHPEDRERVRAEFDTLRSRPRPFEFEFRVVRPDGQLTWVHTTGEATADPVEGLVLRGIHQDVTARKLAELALAAEARRKDEFLATLSHELRNPLAAITTAVTVLGAPGVDEGGRARAAAVANRQALHLGRLVDDLLDVSRISRGEVSLRLELVDLAEVVRAAVDAEGRSTDHELVVTVPSIGRVVRGDTVRLAQVVGNLLDNARKYTPAGGRIGVELREVGERIEIRVEDTGIGIPTHLLGEVFELFAQADRTFGRRGLGVGLTIVRQLVQLHRGTVSLASDGPGTGTRVVVSLPSEPAPAPAAAAVDRGRAAIHSRRVLVVDDNVDAADATTMFLQLAGHDVVAAYGGLDALARGDARPPEVVLLDLGMPGLDGFETARRIRGRPWGQRVRLIAVSGWGQAEDRRKTAEGGFDAHAHKPVDLDQLLALVEAGAPIRSSE